VKKLYFAYGSNLDINRLQDRIGKVEVVSKHKLYGWRLVFNAGQGHLCFANLQMTPQFTANDYVDGVIYSVSSKQLKQLDQYEGAPRFYTRIVEQYRGKDMYVYVSFNPEYTQQENKKVFPCKEYLNFMIKGAVAFKLDNVLNKCRTLYSNASNIRRAFA
jgi:gamma-glutamylcyclotransferase (GGCT)/AIG2-like uncharacterized protein YtfP